MINPMNMMKLKGMFEKFQINHPKVPMFFAAAAPCVDEDSVIEISITTAEGKKLCTNMRVTKDDLELIEQIKKLSEK